MVPLDPHDELRQARLRRGWLRPELVDKLQQWEDEHGSGKPLPVDRNYIYRWETGKRGVSEFYAIRLEAVLGISRDRLIDRRSRHRNEIVRKTPSAVSPGTVSRAGDAPADVVPSTPDAAEDLRRDLASDEGVNRRDLLGRAVALSGALALLPLESVDRLLVEIAGECPEVVVVRDALMRYASASASADPAAESVAAVDIRTLEVQVRAVWRARQASQYRRLCLSLPSVLGNAQVAARWSSGDDRRRGNALLAESYQCVTGAMAKIGQTDLAWIAADRGIAAAERSEDSLVVAASARMLAHAFLGMGRYEKALEVTTAALLGLEPGLGTATPPHLSVYGALCNTSAIAAAKRGDRVRANQFLAEAASMAKRLGRDRNDFWTVFGPTNVEIHRVSVSVDLGDGGHAVEQARTVHLRGLPCIERRTHHLLDVAHGNAQWGKDHEAIDSLLEAERLAPQEVHYQPAVQRLVLNLLHRDRGANKAMLRGLASRSALLT